MAHMSVLLLGTNIPNHMVNCLPYSPRRAIYTATSQGHLSVHRNKVGAPGLHQVINPELPGLLLDMFTGIKWAPLAYTKVINPPAPRTTFRYVHRNKVGTPGLHQVITPLSSQDHF